MSPEQLLGELQRTQDDRIVIGDLEAGTGTLLRMAASQVDAALVVAEPSAKAVDIAARAVRTAAHRGIRVIVVANRVRDEDDVARVQAAVGNHEVVAVPDDPGIGRADREGRAPIDAAPDGAGVRALTALAERLVTGPVPVRDGRA